jgi:hypothetical protein
MKLHRGWILAVAALTGSSVKAGDFPKTALVSMGYEEAAPADFAATPGYQKRLADPSGFLAVSADFNGDGKMDEARLLINRDWDEAFIVVTIMTVDLDTYVLDKMPLAQAARVGIRPAQSAPGSQKEAVAGLSIFKLDGTSERLEYFNGEGFVTR